MLAIDFETTGLLRPELAELHLQPCVTEVYVAQFDFKGKIIKEFESYIKPPVPIPEEITKITGITNQMVEHAPKFIEIIDELINFFLGQEIIFAHNCSYDMGVLACELKRLDMDYRFPWPHNQICTVEKTFAIKNKRMALPDLYELATGKKLLNNHRAKNDVKAMIECIVWMKKEGII